MKNLFGQCTKLDECKADKEFVQSEVEVKADKRLVDGKVNRSLFDSTYDELNKMISDILSKLSGHDEEWKKALARLSDDLDGKLDRLEFGPIKDELQRQLRALLKKLNQMHYPQYEDDEAAGIRKQLIQRFHCISCDRAVDMQPQGPVPSIPASAGLPATKSTRPYTTFELEQIRQHAKRLITNKYDPSNVQQPMMDVMDLYATQRACGGSHTMTYPNRRITRMTHVNNLFRDDDSPTDAPTYRNELDVQGADGHVYKGRTDKNRLPNLSAPGTQMTGRGSPKMPRRAHTSMEPPTYAPVAPPSTGSPRPTSARLSRPSSATQLQTTRPVSARGVLTTQLMEVPTGQMNEETEGSPSQLPVTATSVPDASEDVIPPARSPSPTGEQGGAD